MPHDYFYVAQVERFSFYRIPKALFTEERFKPISAEAKIIYGIMLDRMSLSRSNGWLDEQNRVFVIFTLNEVMEVLGCGKEKAVKIMSELENVVGLIERKRQGLGKPRIVYVKNFEFATDLSQSEKPTSEVGKTDPNNTDKSNTDKSNTYTADPKGKAKVKTEKMVYGEYRNVRLTGEELNKLKAEFPDDWQDRIENLSEYMASKGGTYKNHLATIRNWNRMDKQRQKSGKNGSGIPDDDPYAGYDYRW